MVAILEQCTHPSLLEVDGRLQAPANSTLIQRVQTRLFRGERRIFLDLSRVTAIDAAGVGKLIRSSTPQGRQVASCGWHVQPPRLSPPRGRGGPRGS